MLIVISPAKTLDYESPLPAIKATTPRLLDNSAELIAVMRKKSASALSSLMSVSDKIATLNLARFAHWQYPYPTGEARPAIYAFKGDVYIGLDVNSLDKDVIKRAQQRLRILSGLYGLLRPLDLMLPYRLEMGTQLTTKSGNNLYAFWGDRITDLLRQDMKKAKTDILVNLASKEYFSAINTRQLDMRIITPVFEDEKNGRYKIISFSAKKARGMMTAWILANDIQTPQALTHFSAGGYQFSAENSDADTLVFRRPEQQR